MRSEDSILMHSEGKGGPKGFPRLENVPTGQVCIPNISTRERRKRLISGAVELGLGLGILTALLAFGAARGWRFVLLPFFWGAAVGFFQWRDRT